ncbi:MAG TPA: hypothetical protein VIW64_06040 [Pyrinomonadaceae bacterium]|jgi:hypothetical protein
MVLKLTLGIASIAILMVLGIKGLVYHQGRTAASWQEKGSLVEVARRKKAEGQDKATVSEMRVDYAGANIALDEALQRYSVFISELIESKSFVLNSRDIRTWYKFRILETLSRKSYWYCPICSPINEVPEEMGEPNSDEFFVDTIGGVLEIEGVELTQPNNSLHFEKGTRYLVFINLTPSQVGVLAGGPSGVFQLDNNDTLHSMQKANAQLPAEMQRRFGLKLSEFKSHLNR